MLSYLLSCSHLVKKYSKECFRGFFSDSSIVFYTPNHKILGPSLLSCPEVFCQKGVLKILKNSEENTCTGVSF